MSWTPTDPMIVREIKAILNQDKRERLAAGYTCRSAGIFKRLAEHFGLSVHTVLSIRDRRRCTKTKANRWSCPGLTVDPERLKGQRGWVSRERKRREEALARMAARAAERRRRSAASPDRDPASD